MKLTYLGHSAVLVETGDHAVLVDPFLSGGTSPLAPDEVEPTHIVLTHAHGDHYGDTESIARRTGAPVISSAEIVRYVGARGLAGHGMNVGGGFDFPFGRLAFTPALHSSAFPDGTYGGMPMGVILEIEGWRIYHAGDTALFGDMTLIGERGLDLALLPIGDNFTMGPADAVRAAALLGAARVVPIHYDTFPLIAQDAHAFARALEAATDSVGVVLAPGEALPDDGATPRGPASAEPASAEPASAEEAP